LKKKFYAAHNLHWDSPLNVFGFDPIADTKICFVLFDDKLHCFVVSLFYVLKKDD